MTNLSAARSRRTGRRRTTTATTTASIGRVLLNQQPSRTGGQQEIGDLEKRNLIKQQLVLLLHAHKCLQRENEDQNGDNAAMNQGAHCAPCTLLHCNTMKEVLHHMTSCDNGRSCLYAHCVSSKQIIAHWKNCQREDCPVCKPLKTIQNNPSSNSNIVNDMSFLPGPNPVGPNSVVGGPLSTDPLLGTFGSPGPASVNSQQPPGGMPGFVPGAPGPNANTQLSANQMPSGPMSASVLLNDFNPGNMSQDPFRSPNPPNKQVGAMGPHGLPPSMQRTPTDFPTMNLPAPDVPTTSKEWHLSVTKDLRNHLVGKLVKEIFPSPDPNALLDQRIKDLITYARKVEKEIFEMANDREEYYHLLAKKIYKIQKSHETGGRMLSYERHELLGPNSVDPNFVVGGPLPTEPVPEDPI